MGGRPKRVRSGAAEEERKKALELAERTGVPLWGAFRVVRDEISLNALLKSMMRREKFQRLQKSGLDPDLAGHVASGSLPDWRAKVLQDMRRAGRAKFTRDRVEMAYREKLPTALWRFGEEWAHGSVAKARTYDFSFQIADAAEPSQVFKHDVKMLCLPDDMEVVASARRFDKRVVKEGLGASRDRSDRYRPTDEQLAAARDQQCLVKWIFRDGTAIEAKVVAFGRWDADLSIDAGASVTLFFHALHKATDRGLTNAISK